MNLLRELRRIKAELRYNNISFAYFKQCLRLLNHFIKLEDYQSAYCLANDIKNSKVILSNELDKIEYLNQIGKLSNIIDELESKIYTNKVHIR